MPRVETRYYCDICGRPFKSKDLACECEHSHLVPESVDSPKYQMNDRKSTYPESVLVRFKGGKSARYYRK